MNKILTRNLMILLFFGCAENPNKNESKSDDKMLIQSDLAYENVVFDSKKDLVCGMPLKAGISDTAHYNGKVFGFCAKECKVEFLKEPSNFITK